MRRTLTATGGRHRRPGESRSRGSALPVMLIVVAAIGAFVSSFLGRTLMEQSRINQKASLERAHWRSVGQLELAKHILSRSTYTGGKNDAIQLALADPNGLIDGTSVVLEAAGPNRWYRLVSMAKCNGENSFNIAFVRDGATYVSYNYYVEDQSVGVSGRPQGRIHSNDQVEFHFENGAYSDKVSSVNGFQYLNGATPSNTSLRGGGDPSAAPKGMLDNLSLPDLQTDAVYVAPSNVDAEIEFDGDQVHIELWSKADPVQPVTRLRNGIIRVDPSDSLMAVGDGPQEQWTAVYGDIPYTEYEPAVTASPVGSMTSTTAAGPLESHTFAANGVFYFPDRVRAVSGDLNGSVAIVSEADISITGSLRYVNAAGHPVYQNGTDLSRAYAPNPMFERENQGLALIAQNDVRYSENCPGAIEVNGVLVSKEGTVSFDRVLIDSQGQASVDGSPVLRDSVRRYGSILTGLRPVSSVLSGTTVVHGFESGTSLFDAGLLYAPPPGMPYDETVQFVFTHRYDRSDLPDAGDGVLNTGWTRLGDPIEMDLVELIYKEVRFREDGADWADPVDVTTAADVKTNYKMAPAAPAPVIP